MKASIVTGLPGAVLFFISSCSTMPQGPEDNFAAAVSARKAGNYAEAANLYRRAAEQGHVEAQYIVGYMHERGDGVVQDSAEAARWLRRAAEQGHTEAQLNLGLMYVLGDGVTKDAPEAELWYRRAAEQGHSVAQYNLGYMYDREEAVTRDPVQAYAWYSLAAAQEHAEAAENLAILEKEMSQDQITEAKRMSRQLRPGDEPTSP